MMSAPARFLRTSARGGRALARVAAAPRGARVGVRSFSSSAVGATPPLPSSLWTTTTTNDGDGTVPRRKSWNLTKIVATVGPTSEQFEVLQPLVRAGLRIMRLNFSHATVEEVELRVRNLDACKGENYAGLPQRWSDGDDGRFNLRATLLDTRGPEIRTGKLRHDDSGHETVSLRAGDALTLRTDPEWRDLGGTSDDLFVDYAGLTSCARPGGKVLLDDGAVTLTVSSIDDADGSVHCTIDNAGELRSRAGVNLPGASTDLPALTDKDRADIRYGLTKDVDFVAASFVQSAENVREIRSYVVDAMAELGLEDRPPPLLISKIESVNGLRNFHSILDESDGVMVARGDLGVEIPLSKVTNAQKAMVAACNAAGKPVVVATQMLESMAKNPRPTRAEVADVANAVYDGADCVMTSGETAKGRYPVATLETMDEIVREAETFRRERPDLTTVIAASSDASWRSSFDEPGADFDVAGAAVAATRLDPRVAAVLVASATNNGKLARSVAGHRPDVPVVAFCSDARTGRRLIIHRGVHPVVVGSSPKDGASSTYEEDARAMGFVESGDRVVVVSADDAGRAVMRVSTVP